MDHRLEFSQSGFYQACYHIKSSTYYNYLLSLLSFSLMLLSFWEPSNRHVTNFDYHI